VKPDLYRYEHRHGGLHFEALRQGDRFRCAGCGLKRRLEACERVARQAHERRYGVTRQRVHRLPRGSYAEPQRFPWPLRDLVKDDAHIELREHLRHVVESPPSKRRRSGSVRRATADAPRGAPAGLRDRPADGRESACAKPRRCKAAMTA
jgi:hypothetical protein